MARVSRAIATSHAETKHGYPAKQVPVSAYGGSSLNLQDLKDFLPLPVVGRCVCAVVVSKGVKARGPETHVVAEGVEGAGKTGGGAALISSSGSAGREKVRREAATAREILDR
jgi:hypothetical protein